MKRYIFFSWTFVILALVLSTPLLSGKSSLVSSTLFVIGYSLITLPYLIWLWIANKYTSKALGVPPSKLINGLGLYFTVAYSFVWYILVFRETFQNSDLQSLLLHISFLSAFASVIIASFLSARRLVDAEDSSKLGRKSRIFVAFLGFFYIMIGMFFFAKRLKNLDKN